MTSDLLCPSVGCVVEFLQDNQVQYGWVLAVEDGRLRLFTLQLREVNMAAARLLPWSGPKYEGPRNREEIISILQLHRRRRESLAGGVNPELLWDLAQGEKESAGAEWFAELAFSNIASNWLTDGIAAVGQVLLSSKTHFRFNPPLFELNSLEQVEARLARLDEERSKAALLEIGQNFFKGLWEVHLRRRERSEVLAQLEPKGSLRQALLKLLYEVLSSPQQREQNTLWRQLSKSLGDGQHLPLFLAIAWGLVPEHYAFWFDRAGYDPNPAWSKAFQAEIDLIQAQLVSMSQSAAVQSPQGAVAGETPTGSLSWNTLVSIDSASTRDIDDAFFLESLPSADGKEAGGFRVRLALACPALVWPFTYTKSGLKPSLDVQVLQRASSIYLPEGSFHMMPEVLATGDLSLEAQKTRPALLVELVLDADGSVCSCQPSVDLVTVAANLSFKGCEAVLNEAAPVSVGVAAEASGEAPDQVQGQVPGHAQKRAQTCECPAGLQEAARPYAGMLLEAEKLSKILRAARIKNGAVIIEKPDPEIKLASATGEPLPEFWNSEESGWGVHPPALNVVGLNTLEQGTENTGGSGEYWRRWKPWSSLQVEVFPGEESPRAQLLVGELMILVNTALATWAQERGVSLLYRTQDLDLPPEFAGEWTAPADIARIVKGMNAAQLGLTPKPHMGIGVKAYASFSSPLRRYVDLINERQVLSCLELPHYVREALAPEIFTELSQAFSKAELEPLLVNLHANMDPVMQAQRFRVRYLKLLALKQAGEQAWHDAVITEVRETFVFVSLNTCQLIVRGKRATFGDKIQAGQHIKVRLGKIHPLNNEINILGAAEPEDC